MAQKGSVNLFQSAARTSTVASSAVDIPGRSVAFYLDVTAGSGTTPTLDVDIEVYDPESESWFVLISFTQATGVTSERKAVTDLADKRLRANATIGGTTPSFTFTLQANYSD